MLCATGPIDAGGPVTELRLNASDCDASADASAVCALVIVCQAPSRCAAASVAPSRAWVSVCAALKVTAAVASPVTRFSCASELVIAELMKFTLLASLWTTDAPATALCALSAA